MMHVVQIGNDSRSMNETIDHERVFVIDMGELDTWRPCTQALVHEILAMSPDVAGRRKVEKDVPLPDNVERRRIRTRGIDESDPGVSANQIA